jgi:hypothetical protein
MSRGTDSRLIKSVTHVVGNEMSWHEVGGAFQAEGHTA